MVWYGGMVRWYGMVPYCTIPYHHTNSMVVPPYHTGQTGTVLIVRTRIIFFWKTEFFSLSKQQPRCCQLTRKLCKRPKDTARQPQKGPITAAVIFSVSNTGIVRSTLKFHHEPNSAPCLVFSRLGRGLYVSSCHHHIAQ